MSLYLNMSLYPDRRTCPYKWTICNFQPFPKHIFSPIRTCPYIRVHTRNMNPSNSRIEIRDRQNFESVILKCLTHFSQTGRGEWGTLDRWGTLGHPQNFNNYDFNNYFRCCFTQQRWTELYYWKNHGVLELNKDFSHQKRWKWVFQSTK